MAKKKNQPTQSDGSPGVQIWLAIISGLVAIILALLAFPPFQRLFEPKPTPTPISTIEPTFTASITGTSTSTAEPTPTETHTPIPTETFTLAPPTETATNMFTSTPMLPSGIQVILRANQTNGNAPLRVRLDARESYLRNETGSILPCGPCNYTWQIRQGANIIFGPERTQGTLEFTFVAKGSYFVSVFVCRSSSTTNCGSSGTPIEVKK